LNAPPDASLNSSNGLFAWRPPVASAITKNLVTVKVADNGTPSLSATQSFLVIVNPVVRPNLTALTHTSGSFSFQVNGQIGPDYTIQTSTNLVDWIDAFTTNSPPLPFGWTDPNSVAAPAKFYRLVLSP